MLEFEVVQRGRKLEAGYERKRSIAMSRLVLLTLYAVAILFLGTRRTLTFPGDEILSYDKLLHAVAFGGLGVLGFRLLGYQLPHLRKRWINGLSIALASLVGLGLELIQSRLPYRSMEFADLVADIVGAFVFVLGAQRLRLDRPILGL